MNTTHVRCFTGPEGLLQLKPAWLELFSTCLNPSFYNDWRWHQAIQQHLVHQEVHFFAVYEDTMLVGILPLVRQKKRRCGIPVSCLTFPSHSTINASDMLIREGKTHIDIVGVVLAYINQSGLLRWDMLELTHFTDRSGTRAVAGSGAEPMGQSSFVRRGAYGRLLDALSKKKVRNTRRQQKNAETGYGPVKYTQVTAPSEIIDAYDTFLNVEASSWKGESGTQSAIRLQPDTKAFYQTVITEFADTNEAVINLLQIGPSPVAAQIGLRTEGCLFLLKIGYDEALRGVGPGGIILLHCLEKETSHSEELNLVTSPPWAEQWHFTTEKTWSRTYFNSTFYARLLALGRHGRRALRELLLTRQ